MKEARSWQESLQEVLRDPQAAAVLADELEVNPIVLRRWAAGETVPLPNLLSKLLEKLADEQP